MTTKLGQDSPKSDAHDRGVSFSPPFPSRGPSPWGWVPLVDGEVRCLVPRGLIGVAGRLSRADRDKALMTFSFVVGRWFNERCDPDGFTSIHRNTLQSLFGVNYSKYIRFLSDHGMIEVSHSYQTGRKTKRYKAIRDDLVPVTIRNKPLANKMERRRKETTQETIERAKEMNRDDTVKWMMKVIKERMGFDEFKANDLLRTMESTNEHEWHQELYAMLAVEALQDGRLAFSMCPRSGRFFSNITNLPRQFRQFLRMDGVRMVDVDIKTAQPYLLSTLYPHREGEWHRFREDIQNYDFYERIAPDVERDKAKHQVYTYVLFGENNVCLRGDMWYMFKTWYPELAGIIWEMKKKDHASVAIQLQKVEADGMIGGVARELAEQEVPFITIHDGMLIKKPQAEKAKQLIIKHFTEITGFEPEVKIK